VKRRKAPLVVHAFEARAPAQTSLRSLRKLEGAWGRVAFQRFTAARIAA
jgi:hypothetical protein